MSKIKPLLDPPPSVSVLISWLREAAEGGVTPAGMRRLCGEAAAALDRLTTEAIK